MKNKIKNKQEENVWKKRWDREGRNILFNILFAGFALVIILLFYDKIILTTVLEITLGSIGLIKWKSKVTLIVYFIAFLGAITEMIVIATVGAWNYTLPNFWNIPIWLFFLWGNAGAFIYETAKEVKKMRGNKEN
jgi:hypothetical protein